MCFFVGACSLLSCRVLFISPEKRKGIAKVGVEGGWRYGQNLAQVATGVACIKMLCRRFACNS